MELHRAPYIAIPETFADMAQGPALRVRLRTACGARRAGVLRLRTV